VLKDTLYCDDAQGQDRRSAQTALWEICSALTRLLAPILSFTADEAWQELRKKDASLPASVFLADFPAADAALVLSEEMKTRWAKLLGIRERALLEFEKLRKEKKIGSNMEACLQLYVDKDDEDAVKDAVIELHDRLGLSAFIKDMILQLLVKGDAVGFKRYSQDGHDIDEITCVNPVSVRVKYAHGQLLEVCQYPEDTPAAGEGLMLPVEQTIHLKWDAPEFSQRGNSLVLPAFQSIELLRDYRRAEQAIAKRWATPLRLIKVGGAFGQKMIAPDQKMLEQVRDMMNKMDMKSGLVVPFYVSVETHGTDGQVLNVEEKVKEVKEDIIVALSLSRSLVTGDGPNFATASVSMQKMMVMIRRSNRRRAPCSRGSSTTGWSCAASRIRPSSFCSTIWTPATRWILSAC
jgi:hypothetical protein